MAARKSIFDNLTRKIFIVNLPQLPIFKQLLLEEAIYRLAPSTTNGWLLLNDFAAAPVEFTCFRNNFGDSHNFRHNLDGTQSGTSIVLGSGTKRLDGLVNKEAVAEDNVEVIRRYTGGGTVVIHPAAAFIVSMLLPTNDLFSQRAFPRDVMKWSGTFYKRVFPTVNGHQFDCFQNDYTIQNVEGSDRRKIGGIAQAIGQRFISHHTSFLWNPDFEAMRRYLLMPKKQPEYRSQRPHEDFLCGLKCDLLGNYFGDTSAILERVSHEATREFVSRGFQVERVKWKDIQEDAEKLVQQFIEHDSAWRGTWLVDLNGEPIRKQHARFSDAEIPEGDPAGILRRDDMRCNRG